MIKYKYLSLYILTLITSTVLFGQKTNYDNTFYIVRHAEKDTGNNPILSLKGKQRAGDLYRELKNKKIDFIFVSQYRRTGLTGDSLRIYQHIDSIHYTADTSGNLLFQKINELGIRKKNILIIGHSNTLPGIIRKAGALNFTLKEIPDYEYDHLFIVKQKGKKATLKSEKYGMPSVVPAKATQMSISQ